jgi:hypothetical protein
LGSVVNTVVCKIFHQAYSLVIKTVSSVPPLNKKTTPMPAGLEVNSSKNDLYLIVPFRFIPFRIFANILLAVRTYSS